MGAIDMIRMVVIVKLEELTNEAIEIINNYSNSEFLKELAIYMKKREK